MGLAGSAPSPYIPGVLGSFSAIADDYDVIFLDSFGVLKNSRGVLPGVMEVLEDLVNRGKDLYVVTNDASKSPKDMADQFPNGRDGDIIPPERWVSSGLMATEYLRAKVRSGTVAYLGPPESAFYVRAAGLTPIRVTDCTPSTQVQAFVLLDDEGFDWQTDLNFALNFLRRNNVPAVVANADPVYPVGDGGVSVAVGALGRLLESLVGKRFVHFGKPDAYMFSFAYDKALVHNPALDKARVLMVGDTLETDIQGGNKFGIDTMLVLTGNTAPERADLRIQSTGLIPTHICESLVT